MLLNKQYMDNSLIPDVQICVAPDTEKIKSELLKRRVSKVDKANKVRTIANLYEYGL